MSPGLPVNVMAGIKYCAGCFLFNTKKSPKYLAIIGLKVRHHSIKPPAAGSADCDSNIVSSRGSSRLTDLKYLEFHKFWPDEEKMKFQKDMLIVPDFLSENDEKSLLDEIEPYLKRMRYEFDHWDDAIHGYRETERKNWYPDNRKIIQRVADIAFKGEILPYIHVLDLAENGIIKPHVDSTRYCGTTIGGLSLLSDSVMRMIRTDEKKYTQKNGENHDEYRSQPSSGEISDKDSFYADILLTRRSLYIMSHTARYNFTHEILGNSDSMFKGKPIKKTRRVSIICRNNP